MPNSDYLPLTNAENAKQPLTDVEKAELLLAGRACPICFTLVDEPGICILCELAQVSKEIYEEIMRNESNETQHTTNRDSE